MDYGDVHIRKRPEIFHEWLIPLSRSHKAINQEKYYSITNIIICANITEVQQDQDAHAIRPRCSCHKTKMLMP